MRPQILLDYIIEPVLARMGDKYNTKAARQLLLATAAQESHCGSFFKQVKGPALGIYQFEEWVVDDLYTNYLNYRPDRKALIDEFLSPAEQGELALMGVLGNTHYATAIARMQYFRQPEKMPEFDDFDAMWSYYKKYWNTEEGKATKEEFYYNWNRYVTPTKF